MTLREQHFAEPNFTLRPEIIFRGFVRQMLSTFVIPQLYQRFLKLPESGSGKCDANTSDASKFILKSRQTPHASLSIDGVNTLPGLFRWQALRRGDATLFTFREQPEADLKTVSYQDALEVTTRLARALRGLFPVSRRGALTVGIWFERSIELHFAVLATTISGAAWLPFDPDAPSSRVEACLADSKACVLLCDAAHYDAAVKATAGVPDCYLLKYDDLTSLSQNRSLNSDTIPEPDPRGTAYFIYTSGSTGTPKGIEISHHAALTFSLSERSILETAGGAQLAIGSRADYQDVPGMGGVSGIWAQRGVTIVNAVPTLINIMTSFDDETALPPTLRLLNLGGEACPSSLVKRLEHSRLRILNTYGPSETTVTATFQELFPGDEVTIGRPLPMYHALLLTINEDGATAPLSPLELQEGVEGELAIGGPCLGNGYVGRPELTAEKFMQHPIPTCDGERLYRTGDRVRLDHDWNLIFIGRIDSQVKHRGFRIELGEIENSLNGHPDVQVAAVILSKATNTLEAYVVARDGVAMKGKDLLPNLQSLPAYMYPEAYHFITAGEMPRLPSGKVNLKALQDVSASLAAQMQAELDENRDDSTSTLYDNTEMGNLLRIMGDVFTQTSDITPTSDFFDDLGGHSLAAATLVSRLRKESAKNSVLKNVALKDIYTLRTASNIIEALGGSKYESGILDEDVPKEAEPVDHWPVSDTAFMLCGLAQVPSLVFFFFIEGVAILGPYLLFYYALHHGNVGWAILATYLAFVVAPIMKFIVGVGGKWLSLGRAKAGEYPLYGFYYYRWWLAERFVELIEPTVFSGTALAPAVMRSLGAKVGSYCNIEDPVIGAAFDLVTIGNDVVLGRETVLSTSWVERGRLILAPIQLESSSCVGSQCVLEGGCTLLDGAEVGHLTMVPSGVVIPAGERWTGSPAQFRHRPEDIGHMRSSRPGFVRFAVTALATSFTSVFVMPLMYFVPQIPSILLFDYVRLQGFNVWTKTAVVAVPATCIYFFLVFLELLIFKWVILGKVRECSYRTTSLYHYRKWFVDRLMDMSLVVLQPVYATLYVVPSLRSLGVKIGHRAEVSNARGINFELTKIGDESFVADGVYIGDRKIRSNTITLTKTTLHPRAFAGNQSMLLPGTTLPSNSLVGVLSISPKLPLKDGQSCFGSPAVMMSVRQAPKQIHPDHLLWAPRWNQIALRLFIEGSRIFLPRLIIIFGLGFGTQLFQLGITGLDGYIVFLIPFIYFFLFALPALLFTAAAKWVLIGRYTATEWPLWSSEV
ncbi:putative secondary metabolism biosynthetic enzyme [Venturia effusa]|uniref:Putative secondary metabolism biosynthetic enzyme n=1 Tax=Venturia effusa TaxID=50376 RepID=A0A517LDN2_9PEZI|nr:putative secondary metabolism biosynthetic enzyme [Venturia effusa]